MKIEFGTAEFNDKYEFLGELLGADIYRSRRWTRISDSDELWNKVCFVFVDDKGKVHQFRISWNGHRFARGNFKQPSDAFRDYLLEHLGIDTCVDPLVLERRARTYTYTSIHVEQDSALAKWWVKDAKRIAKLKATKVVKPIKKERTEKQKEASRKWAMSFRKKKSTGHWL